MLNLDELKRQFNIIDFREKRPGIFKVLLPFFHEDGDMYDVFIEEINDYIRISDYGLTMMKLSYNFEFDTDHKQEILEGIILQNRCKFKNGTIYLDILPKQFEGAIYQFVQTISKVCTMDIISKEDVKSYFYELLDNYIDEHLKNYQIEKDHKPLPNSDLTVDYVIPIKKPIYLFAVKDDTKASKVVISCLTFITQKINYRSLIVSEDLLSLNKFYQSQIINTADKVFTRLEDFQNKGAEYLQREIAN